MSYTRVLPRDLFNESKLLKCLGQLSLCILDRRVNGLPLVEIFEGNEFQVIQNPLDGSLSCLNYRLYLENVEIELFTPLNSRNEYPLIGRYKDGDYYLFDENGKFIPNFGYEL